MRKHVIYISRRDRVGGTQALVSLTRLIASRLRCRDQRTPLRLILSANTIKSAYLYIVSLTNTDSSREIVTLSTFSFVTGPRTRTLHLIRTLGCCCSLLNCLFSSIITYMQSLP
jgi:hypothetical protein